LLAELETLAGQNGGTRPRILSYPTSPLFAAIFALLTASWEAAEFLTRAWGMCEACQGGGYNQLREQVYAFSHSRTFVCERAGLDRKMLGHERRRRPARDNASPDKSMPLKTPRGVFQGGYRGHGEFNTTPLRRSRLNPTIQQGC